MLQPVLSGRTWPKGNMQLAGHLPSTGIVRIEIQNPDNVLYGQMERELEKALGLKEAIIVPGGLGPEGTSHSDAELGRATLKYLARNIHEGDYNAIVQILPKAKSSNQRFNEAGDICSPPVMR